MSDTIKVTEAVACKLLGHTVCPACGSCADCTSTRAGVTDAGTHRWLSDGHNSFRCNDTFKARKKGWWFLAGVPPKEATWKR